jgi:hypothetical protein
MPWSYGNTGQYIRCVVRTGQTQPGKFIILMVNDSAHNYMEYEVRSGVRYAARIST